MNLPIEYQTGNRKYDEKIAKALAKLPPRKQFVIPELQPINSAIAQYLTEYDECVLLGAWLEDLKSRGNLLNYTHVPNETYTESQAQKMRNKEQGVKAGVPDYFVLTFKCLVVVEMKQRRKSSISPFQEEWLSNFTTLNIPNKVCYGVDEAKAFITTYL